MVSNGGWAVGAHDPQVADVLASASDVWDRFVESIARLDPAVAGASLSTDAWTPKQIIGHVAFWDGYAVEHPDQLVQGLTLDESEWEPLNTATARAIAASTWEDVISQLHTNHAQMLASIAPRSSRSRWLGSGPTITISSMNENWQRL